MKNKVGNPARGTDFFKREKEVEKIVQRLADGNNLQIAAPRRVGKTSILWYLLDNKINGYAYVYVDTEAIDDSEEFFKKLLKAILASNEINQSARLKELFNKGIKALSKIKSIKILGHGFDLNETKEEHNYYEDLTNLLSAIELDNSQKLVLLIDEFPQTIQNMVERANDDEANAKKFLQLNRDLRLNPEINERVNFIYTGSIGLNHTVASINSTAFVNDLSSVEIDALSKEDAETLLSELLLEKNITIENTAKELLLQKLEWLIPFHIQLAVQELTSLVYAEKHIETKHINLVFAEMIEARNNNHFEHYSSRLKSQFKGEAFNYAAELLQKLAKEETLTKTQLFDLSVKFNQEDNYRQILEILVYDGYIHNTGDVNTYRFNSPIVRMWWQKFICK
ncbi:MAG: hypothetical protein MUE72_03725 [Chitinophagaceae bacterium]|jgi:hypothetical protein|nr:hypothetical protein [Chitinophagaceae bacterium]